MTPPARHTAAANLNSAIREGVSVLDRVSNYTRRLSLEGTATLVGIFGGLLTLSVAYGLSLAVPAVSFTVASPIALGLGISGGILAFRGTGAAKLDREMDNRKRAASYLLEQIKSLPKSAPSSVRTGLYVEYHKVVTGSVPVDLQTMQALEHAGSGNAGHVPRLE